MTESRRFAGYSRRVDWCVRVVLWTAGAMLWCWMLYEATR